MHSVGSLLALDMEFVARKLSVVPHARSLFVAIFAVAGSLACDDREPEVRAPAPPPPAAAPSRSVGEITGWPAGLGRALVVRLQVTDDPYRLIVPELGDRRFADSAISVRAGDSLAVALLGRRGKLGDARLRVVDSESGTGSCITWPSAEIVAATHAGKTGAASWRIAVERDSVTPVAVDSLAAMTGADSASFVTAVHSLLASVPQAADSGLRGIPFGIRRAYSFRVAGIRTMAAEVARTSSTEADPREERMFVIGERDANAQAHRLVYSRRAAGRADSLAVTELLAVMIVRQPQRGVIALGIEDHSGMRIHLLERSGRRWRRAWSSVVSVC